MDKEQRLTVVVQLMQFGFTHGSKGLVESLLDCHPDERHLTVDVIAWFERQSGNVDVTTASLIESGLLSQWEASDGR